MKVIATLSFLLVTFFLYGFYLNQYELAVVPPQITSQHSSRNLYDYKGVLNVHTDLSSGSATSSFVITSAKLANLDFIFFTDYNVFNIPTTFESYHGNLLVFNAGKYSYLDSRLIYYSLNQESIGANLGDAQVKLSDLLSQKTGASKDTLTILAHPYKAGYSWSGEIPSGLDGFELLNMKSLINRAWAESKISTIWSLLIYPFNPRLAFVRLYTEPTDEIALLNKLSQQRKVVVYAGTEASARAIPLANYFIRFPSYKRSFEFMSNHVLLKSELTGSFNSDRTKIFNAIKNGSFYIALDTLGDPKGFSATIEDGNHSHMMGSEVKFSKNMSLKVILPAKPQDFFEIMIIKDGEVVARKNDPEPVFEIKEPGTYRVQVRVSPMLPIPDAKKWITWIYTNPFYVRP
ncbi:hypothetical protein AB1A81_17590 [Bdellovibrio bacteriovorus]|uniref:Uncharacterized protein n=1 Tax=Bdellovibrio bacteriovorus (strain ATCC 15356 / DSM 50701 / NCIMB 9529 / HD100) TaxID=264462 RepID=Q6MGT9_BDEBA|nr:hypothetical protein [Bdellovibrio bacteriovorus]AHZ85585.1 hypothetical protein EP01_11660 [Bdellovibrio bacteriovorus]BEV70131.1 hypothetical protein Bb109J_c3551 [Bdellovibrio bacteriovorus]CAE81190.1 hypothetical protein predicted by Glimmer/Critica [Bdellovibrio bacteriovorus HD100]